VSRKWHRPFTKRTAETIIGSSCLRRIPGKVFYDSKLSKLPRCTTGTHITRNKHTKQGNYCLLLYKQYHPRILVPEHYLLREANSFSCTLWGKDDVQGQISEHVFAPNGGFCVYHPSIMFRYAHNFENWGISLGYLLSLKNLQELIYCKLPENNHVI